MTSKLSWRRAGAYAGLFIVILSGSVLTVSLLSNPWFSLQYHSLSDLGRRSARLTLVYNGGLVVSGVLLLFFCTQVFRESETRLSRGGVVLFGLTGIALLLIGYRSNGVTLPESYALGLALSGGTGVFLLAVSLSYRGVAYARLFAGVVVSGTFLALLAIHTFDGLAIAELIAIAEYDVTLLIFSYQLLQNPRDSCRTA
ncbi:MULTISPECIES: DUF998 domain-containing protein [Haloferax]|nr:DUF998 domain-containing protein [Haloferax mediterranei]